MLIVFFIHEMFKLIYFKKNNSSFAKKTMNLIDLIILFIVIYKKM